VPAKCSRLTTPAKCSRLTTPSVNYAWKYFRVIPLTRRPAMAALRAWGLCGGTGSGAKTMGWPDGAHRRKSHRPRSRFRGWCYRASRAATWASQYSQPSPRLCGTGPVLTTPACRDRAPSARPGATAAGVTAAPASAGRHRADRPASTSAGRWTSCIRWAWAESARATSRPTTPAIAPG
jgi:hypothetical protein